MSVGKLSEFNLSGGSWNTYIERFEQYFKANDVEAEKKVAILIACVGDVTYELMVDLCSPEKPAHVSYDDLVNLVGQHLEPKPSVLAERYKFRKRTQLPNESVANFAAALKHLSRNCDFARSLDDNLRDQFVCGLASETTRQRLFCEDISSYKMAYKVAVSLEAAAKNALAVEQCTDNGDRVMAIAARQGRGGGGGPGAWRTGGASARAPGSRAGSGSSGSGGGTTGPRKHYSACSTCGSKEHSKDNCKFKEYVCRMCLVKGHLQRVCPNKHRSNVERRVYNLESVGEGGENEPVMTVQSRAYTGRNHGSYEGNDHYEDYEDYVDGGEGPSGLYMVQLNGSEPVVAEVTVAGYQLRMHVDTGSPIACISDVMYKNYFSKFPLQQKHLNLKGYDGKRIECLGYFGANVIFGQTSKILNLFVIANGGVPLLGREWLKELRMDILVVNSMVSDQSAVSFDKDKFIQKYPTVFSGKLGKLISECATLRVREGAQPVYRRARPLPLALRPRVDAELQRMEDQGIISPIATSDWASCLVVVIKSNGALRICGDYKSTVNPVLDIDRYPLPRAEYLFHNLSGGKRFTKLDLSEAYSQVCLDDTKKYTVVNTHRGLYVYNRLVYGIASAPSIFQRILERVIAGIPNVSNFLDDILITGPTEEDHIKNLNTVFQRLAKEGLTIRQEKCVFFAKEVSYLGLIISEQGIRSDRSKIEAVCNAPEPTNLTELKSFIGMANFYAKFIKGFAQILAPLYDLLKKENKWTWLDRHRCAFNSIKNALTTCPVLIHYNEKLPLVLTCDASGRGVGAVLTHRTEDGERPVAYASRTLTPAEANYSQIQREALAIVFGVQKFNTYLYGRRFILRTDHQPLTTIFGSKKDLPHTASGRLIRWAILLSGYTYDIEYVRSSQNKADALSRLPLRNSSTSRSSKDEQVYIKFIEDNFPINSSDLRQESNRDRMLVKVLGFVRNGWPASISRELAGDSELAAYWRRRDELYVEGGCLLWGCRVIVPEKLRAGVLAEVHGAHLGIVKCKGIARSYVWWPGVDEDIEKMCASCLVCAQTADAPPRSVVIPWSWPKEPFERVHIDFLSYKGETYLAVVDSHSKWIEALKMTSMTTSDTIVKLKELFARFGIPNKIVSDNGPTFTSDEFLLFLRKNGIKHVTSSPYHPSSNGEAENAVRTIKRALKKADALNVPRYIFLQRYLLDYRNSIHMTTGETPARLMLGRNLKTRLDLLKNNLIESVKDKLGSRAGKKGGKERVWGVEDKVWIKDFRAGRKWTKGKIVNRKCGNVYEVESEDGYRWSRHADQLRNYSDCLEDEPKSSRSSAAVAAQAAIGGAFHQNDASESSDTRNVSRRIRKPPIRYGYDEFISN